FGIAGLALRYAEAFVEPFGTLWFIYLLPIFFVVTKLARHVPPLAIWLVAAALEIAPIATGWTMIDEFASRFVYFYTGYILAPHIFTLASAVQKHPWPAFGGLVIWALVNNMLVFGGYSELAFVSLALGLAGAAAVIAVSALLSLSHLFAPLRYCGRNSIVIYLAFFLPMAASRLVLLKTGVITDIGTISALVTAAGVIGALMWYWALRGTPLRVLFERPRSFQLAARQRFALQPAE
ncbi:MAG: hypothetical protein QOD74_1700, partial [Variibacter sp.]|nr:hypothetical protein [Variibacter sp.]